jgi:hypothetical protein
MVPVRFACLAKYASCVLHLWNEVNPLVEYVNQLWILLLVKLQAKKTVLPKTAQDMNRVMHGAIVKGKAKLCAASAPPPPAPLDIEDIELTLDARLATVLMTSIPIASGSILPVLLVTGLISALPAALPASITVLPSTPTFPVAVSLLLLVELVVFTTISPASLVDSPPSFIISHAQMGVLIDQVQTQHLAALWAKGLLCDTVLLPASSAC